jgi:hypothetical protein
MPALEQLYYKEVSGSHIRREIEQELSKGEWGNSEAACLTAPENGVL